MKFKNLICGAFIIALLISCSDENSENNSGEVAFNHYVINSVSDYNDPSQPQTSVVTTGNLLNNKLYSETVENFTAEILQNTVTTQNYFYESGRLVQRNINSGVNQFVQHFIYDASGNLIAADITGEGNYVQNYRFVNAAANEIY